MTGGTQQVVVMAGANSRIGYTCGYCGGIWAHDSSTFGHIQYLYCDQCKLWFHSQECLDGHNRDVHGVVK